MKTTGSTISRYNIGLGFLIGMVALASGCSPAFTTEQTTNCPFAIVQAKFLGTLWNQAHARASIISQDGGESFTVPGGAIWAFGDTFKGTRSADGTPHFAGGAISCAIAFLGAKAPDYPPAFDYLVSSNRDAVSPFEFFPDEQPTERYRIWPLGGIYANSQYYLFYSLIEVFGNGQWDFRGVGSGLGRSAVALGPYERLQPHGDWRFPIAPTQVSRPTAGSIYSEFRNSTGSRASPSPAYARKRSRIPRRTSFTPAPARNFRHGRKPRPVWSATFLGKSRLAWNPYLQKYVMVSSSDFDHPREIRFLVADAPYGPWSPPVARVEVPQYAQGKRLEMAYCAYLHPELFRGDGRVMNLTYSTGLENAGFDANCEMVEVEIERR